MTSIRSSLPLLVLLLVAGAGCRGPGPPAAGAVESVGHPLLPALEDRDPAVRRDAAEQLGRLRHAPRNVIDALLLAQYDDDESVSAAAVAALDRIHPGPDVALRVLGGECYEEVVDDLIVRPAFTTWVRVACEPQSGTVGQRVTGCWRLIEIPPVTEARVKHVLAHPEAGRWRDAREVRADDLELLRATVPPPAPPPIQRVLPPAGEPEGAQPGEVWCRHASGSESETEADGTWHRHPECETPSAAP